MVLNINKKPLVQKHQEFKFAELEQFGLTCKSEQQYFNCYPENPKAQCDPDASC